MIGIALVFLGGVITLFWGLNKSESKSLWILRFFMLLSALLSGAEGQGWVDFSELFKWVPAHMLNFNAFKLSMVSILSFFGFYILSLLPSTYKKGADVLGLFAFALTGAMMMVGSQHLVMLFLGLEVLSIPLFVLAGSEKENIYGNEAAMKYFLMGAFSTAIFLLGAAFTYGGSGTLILSEIQMKLSFAAHFGEFPVLLKAGVILMSVGLLFKVSAVPFHFWSPDVYEGSPNRVATFMAVIVKVAGFVAFAQLINTFSPMQIWINQWIVPVSILTILVGNIAALVQQTVKRTLAYSSISHAGYLLLFLILPMEENLPILGTYLLSYGLGTIILFYLMDKYSADGEKSFEMFKNIKNNKIDMAALVIGTLSIAGVPSTIGFVAKYQLFSAAFSQNHYSVYLALLGSAISIAYYFKPFRYALAETNEVDAEQNSINGLFSQICLITGMLLIITLGLLPMITERIF
ncbi:MAG: NADH-quinone oxidoreductase subunit N [Bacteroidia bacterium]|nr:NADH-quinone oxidoreductase subunit N [Bacteroidia bacterium]